MFLRVVEDSMVYQFGSWANQNLGDSISLWASDELNGVRMIFLKFDLSAIPAGASIINASMGMVTRDTFMDETPVSRARARG